MRTLISKVQAESGKVGLNLNLKKTKVMSTGLPTNFTLRNENIEVVNSYVFLGSKVVKDGGCGSEIGRRIVLGKTAMAGLGKLMKDRDISKTTKVKIINTLVFPVVLYGSECWTVKKAERKKIDAFELWCWRRMLRISWTDKRTNKSILEEIKPSYSLETIVVKHRLSYFGHIIRSKGMEQDIMLGKVQGRRRRGRQRIRWLEGVTKETGKSLRELSMLAQDRTAWRKYVRGVTKIRERLDGT